MNGTAHVAGRSSSVPSTSAPLRTRSLDCRAPTQEDVIDDFLRRPVYPAAETPWRLYVSPGSGKRRLPTRQVTQRLRAKLLFESTLQLLKTLDGLDDIASKMPMHIRRDTESGFDAVTYRPAPEKVTCEIEVAKR